MLRPGESGRDSDTVIKICQINALKRCKINQVGKHRCTKAETWTDDVLAVYSHYASGGGMFGTT